MDEMFELPTSQGKQLGKRPALSSSPLNKLGKKRAAEEDEEIQKFILLTVKSRRKEVCFKVKRTLKLQKIIKTFCDKARVKYSNMQFLINGSRFPLTATPDELHMSDGDEIEGKGLRCSGGKVVVGCRLIASGAAMS